MFRETATITILSMKKYTKKQIKEMLYPIVVENFQTREEIKAGIISKEADREAWRQLAQSLHYEVLYNYCSDGPGYVGDMLFVVWGDASIYYVYEIHDGVLVPEPREGCCRKHCDNYQVYYGSDDEE